MGSILYEVTTRNRATRPSAEDRGRAPGPLPGLGAREIIAAGMTYPTQTRSLPALGSRRTPFGVAMLSLFLTLTAGSLTLTAGLIVAPSTTWACDAIAGEAYSDPPEVPRLDLDPKRWHTAARVRELARARKHYVIENETLQSWTELVTWEVTFRSPPSSLPQARDRLLAQLGARCGSLRSRTREDTGGELLFEWSHDGCYGRDPQHHLVRLIQGDIGTHTLSYARATARIAEGELQAWADRLRAIPLESEIAREPSPDVAQARRHFWRAEESAAIALLEPLAVAGDARAQEELAGIYFQRWDLPRARDLFEQAARQDHAVALLHLGRMDENGWGLSAPDVARSLAHYTRAAQLGNVEAQLHLGTLASEATPPRAEEARTWLERAAASGSPEGMLQLARLLARPEGSEGEAGRAAELYERAARMGVADAQLALGQLYAEGRGMRRSDAAAKTWLVRATMQGSDAARRLYLERYAESRPSSSRASASRRALPDAPATSAARAAPPGPAPEPVTSR